jgi:hypothetical protein
VLACHRLLAVGKHVNKGIELKKEIELEKIIITASGLIWHINTRKYEMNFIIVITIIIN